MSYITTTTRSENAVSKENKTALNNEEESIKEEQPVAEETAEETEAVDEFKQKYDELYDKYLRMLAEYDNFKKRTQKEKDELYSFAVSDTLEKLLPVLDNLERAAEAAAEKSPLADGVKMVLKQFGETLEKMNVTPIEAVGKEFDPNIHNAVMHVEDEKVGTNTVVEEFQKGYKYKEKVIRHSMVKVAN
ncbi:MAG: nucleotide exchange factor GrpE [Clostridia bacterium]|nr:nucleotide exchange factor GrpE [Clostridia bacterium]